MSEDVLERVRVFVMSQEPWRAIEALRLIDALAAEVRALRKDRERLEDSIARALLMASGRWSEWGTRAVTVEEILDAAMAREGEA